MDQVIAYFLNLLITLADKHQWLAITLMVIGGLYVLLSLLRGFLTGLAAITKTQKDDKVLKVVFAFLDKYAWGFGKLSEYYETHLPKKDK